LIELSALNLGCNLHIISFLNFYTMHAFAFSRLSTLLIILLISFVKPALANEGMWLPADVKRYIQNMEKLGCTLSADDIYNLNRGSLKDAIVHFGGFCTGEVVSSQGLVFTNHHCGYDAIAGLSTPEKNYLDSGYWAPTFKDELPVKGLFVTFLVRMEDVTTRITYSPNPEEAQKRLIEEIEANGKYTAKITPVFYGNQYLLWVYQTFTDIRFVGTPPASVGKFGGDTDNWMWPRQTGDFSVFRIYANSNNEPAAYSSDNVPYSPKNYLPISLDGVKPGDFSMVMGFPARTSRYLPLSTLKQKVVNEYPVLNSMFGKMLRVMEKDMAGSITVKLALASTQARFANAEKYYLGVISAMKDSAIWKQREAEEAKFQQWAKYSSYQSYDEVLSKLKALNEKAASTLTLEAYLRIGFGLNPIVQRGGALGPLMAALKEKDASKVKAAADKLKETVELDETTSETYKRVLAVLLQAFTSSLPEQVWPEWLSGKAAQKILRKNKEQPYLALADHLYAESFLVNPEKWKNFLASPSSKAADKDPGVQLARAYQERMAETRARAEAYRAEESDLMKTWMKAQMAYQPDRVWYPDANSTLRLTYGQIEGYSTKDAIAFDISTDHLGLLEKYKPGDAEFDLPARLVKLLKAKDFGRYADSKGNLPVNFLSNNDITGGNSGSPVIDGKGRLIGIAFDGNWEGMAGDLVFDPRYKRTISVDIRYVLFCIERLGGAQRLIAELRIQQ